MRFRELLVLGSLLLSVPTAYAGGPALFGLDWGMSEIEVKNLGVKLDAKEKFYGETVYRTMRLPKYLSDANEYTLRISDEYGLIEIVAVSGIIDRSPVGTATDRYLELEAMLEVKYPKIDGPFLSWGDCFVIPGMIVDLKLNNLFALNDPIFWTITARATPEFDLAVALRKAFEADAL